MPADFAPETLRNCKQIMTKDEIRKETIKKRDALTEEVRRDKSAQIFMRLKSFVLFDDDLSEKISGSVCQNCDNFLVYASMGSEVITDDIISDALECGKNVFCPLVTDKDNGAMTFVRIRALSDLRAGYFGIREPHIDASSEVFGADTKGNSLIIVPGVCFDRDRNRIGYKGGFYDRFLERFPQIYSVAVAYNVQISEKTLPFEEHDKRPDKVITETACY